MSKQSLFDSLYSRVIKEDADAEALGISGSDDSGMEGGDCGGGEQDEFGGDEDTVTITLDKETARKLYDVIGAVLGDEEEQGEDEFGGEGDDMGSEDDSLAFGDEASEEDEDEGEVN